MKKKYSILLWILVIISTGQLYAKTTSKKSPSPEEVLAQAREAFFDYDFESAADLYEDYEALIKKAKKDPDENLDIWKEELEIASNAFDRVQRIMIVDSIAIKKNKFFDAIRLSDSAGQLGWLQDLDNNLPVSDNNAAFINDSRDYFITSVPNDQGELRLFEGRRLLDGSWETKDVLEGDFEQSGDYLYPFLSGDGQTFYFANNGPESMGGLDIFVAQKDAITGEFLQPLNLGMPFNSPYDDFMMAIDEETGLGWWATDRNNFENEVVVFVYLLDDIRRNYPPDTENLAALAKITDYKSTWEEPRMNIYNDVLRNFSEKKRKLNSNDSEDFVLNLGNGKTYHKYSDFKNRKASDLMKQYIAKKKELEKKENLLKELRLKYKKDKNLANKILADEEEIDKQRAQVTNLKNEVLRLEKSVR